MLPPSKPRIFNNDPIPLKFNIVLYHIVSNLNIFSNIERDLYYEESKYWLHFHSKNPIQTIQNKTIQTKLIQTKPNKTIQTKQNQQKTKQNQNQTKSNKTKQDQAKQKKTKQNRTKPNKNQTKKQTKLNKTKQKPNKTKQAYTNTDPNIETYTKCHKHTQNYQNSSKPYTTPSNLYLTQPKQ